jgi:hypothetical protein
MLKKLLPGGGSFLFPGCDRISALKKVDFVQKPTLPVARTTCVFISGELSYLAINPAVFPRRQRWTKLPKSLQKWVILNLTD